MKKGHWSILLQGLLGIVFGLLLIVWPLKSLVFITWLVGAYLLLHSIILIIYGLLLPKDDHRGLTVLRGIVGLIAGVILMSGTVVVLEVLVFFFALWSLAAGVIEIILAFLRREEDHDINTLQIFGGLFAILVAVFLFVYPTQTIAFAQVILGIAVLIGGIGTFIYALKAKN